MIDSSAIHSYYDSPAVRKNGRGLTPKIKSFLQDCISYDADCSRIIKLLPLTPTGRENIQYITEEESSAFVDALSDMSNALYIRSFLQRTPVSKFREQQKYASTVLKEKKRHFLKKYDDHRKPQKIVHAK